MSSGAGHPAGLATRNSAAFLAWRYNNPALGYRALAHRGDAESGLIVFRLRRRGHALECVVWEVLEAPVLGADRQAVPSVSSALLTGLARNTAADYLISVIPGARARNLAGGVTRRRFVRLPRTGPVLACRTFDGSVPPALTEWALTMGDVELL